MLFAEVGTNHRDAQSQFLLQIETAMQWTNELSLPPPLRGTPERPVLRLFFHRSKGRGGRDALAVSDPYRYFKR